MGNSLQYLFCIVISGTSVAYQFDAKVSSLQQINNIFCNDFNGSVNVPGADDTCHLDCDYDNKSTITSFHCNNAGTCVIDCYESECFQETVVYASNTNTLIINSRAPHCMERSELHLPINGNVIIIGHDSDHSLNSMVVHSNNTNSISISCLNPSSTCDNMEIYANDAQYLEVNIEETSATNVFIECPDNIKSKYLPQCRIDASKATTFSMNIISNIGAPNGVQFKGNSNDAGTKLTCNNGTSIAFFNVTSNFMDTDCWITYSPTIEPTIVPTTQPTIEPTKQPTIEPTIVPTIYPTIYPTIEPTSATKYPTFNPTHYPSILPTVHLSSSTVGISTSTENTETETRDVSTSYKIIGTNTSTAKWTTGTTKNSEIPTEHFFTSSDGKMQNWATNSEKQIVNATDLIIIILIIAVICICIFGIAGWFKYITFRNNVYHSQLNQSDIPNIRRLRLAYSSSNTSKSSISIVNPNYLSPMPGAKKSRSFPLTFPLSPIKSVNIDDDQFYIPSPNNSPMQPRHDYLFSSHRPEGSNASLNLADLHIGHGGLHNTADVLGTVVDDQDIYENNEKKCPDPLDDINNAHVDGISVDGRKRHNTFVIFGDDEKDTPQFSYGDQCNLKLNNNTSNTVLEYGDDMLVDGTKKKNQNKFLLNDPDYVEGDCKDDDVVAWINSETPC